MSISVKSISVSIDGTQSNKYIINLSGGTFVMSNFCMIERLMNHCTLSFSLVKDPLESITDAQMQVCADIIGKEVELHLQTDPMENELPGYSGDSVADIEFKGFIQSARATRTTSAQYAIKVDALSYDGVLDDHPDYRTFEQMMEKDIIEDQLQAAPKVEFDVAPLLDLEGNPLLYSAKWNETTWGFIRRMAVRYGEWLFHDGRKLYFGKMPEKDAVRLNYPSRELTGYSIQLETRHVNYSQIRSIEAGDLYDFHDYLSEMGDMLNQHNEAAFNASKELYPYQTMSQFTDEACDGIEWNTNKSKTLNLGQAKGTKASLLTYSGSSCCSKLSVGVKLTVVDNYITDDMSGQKSEVPQEEILITQVTHLFSCDDTYSNTFSGLPGNTERPPYANAAAIPYAMPTRAWVEDNDERYHTACVRVVFPWGKAQEDAGREKVLSPWIRVEQPYTSNVAGCYVIPEIGTEVMVDFEGGNAEMPYVRASNFNGIIGEDTDWVTDAARKNNEVKAFRTKNGHTIEIHDLEKDGYIRIYDYNKENYIITFSTDEKLIKLESTGNIELYAQKDIIMKAGHNIESTAGNDITETAGNDIKEKAGRNKNEDAGNTISETAGKDILYNAGNNYELEAGNNISTEAANEHSQHSGKTMYVDSGDELMIFAQENMYQTTYADYTINVKGNTKTDIDKNLSIDVHNNMDMAVTNNMEISAMNMNLQAQNEMKQYSVTHNMNATNSIAISATTSIDIKALIIKEN